MDLSYPDDYINQIICGGCLEVMEGMPNNSIDTIITDPPYGLSFMGKKWDYNVPSIEIWQECLRILKPGGTALIFAGSRTQHKIACGIEDAGFILKDCIMWLYGSGFPKATDISKQLDKRAGAEREATPRIRVDGKKTGKAGGSFISGTVNVDFPEAITPEAKLWNGWKSHGLKPAYEPILVCMKPNEGSYANNALKWGVAGLNTEGGRIPLWGNENLSINREGNRKLDTNKQGWGFKAVSRDNKGRFPANVILDEEAGRMLDKQSTSKMHGAGHKRSAELIPTKQNIPFKGEMGTNYKRFGDTGGASRFFYCAKASKAERNRGCEGLEEKGNNEFNISSSKRIENGIVTGERHNMAKKNNHPTVKPLALMKYLCTLTKIPTGGIVLDPFCGSGTTLMACKELKRDYIGIDNNPEYCEIAKKRINSIPESLF